MANDDIHNNEEEEQEEEDSEAGIDDSMLDEINDGTPADDEPEGFGHIKEEDVDNGEEEEKGETDNEEESLEEDAEDVDYDSFDDEDHL